MSSVVGGVLMQKLVEGSDWSVHFTRTALSLPALLPSNYGASAGR